MTEETTKTLEASATVDTLPADETAEEVSPVGNTTEAGGTQVPPADPETFPREYVQKLRDESAKHRTRAQRADDLAARLHTALVTATGRLADPSDLPFDESHVDDPEALTTAIDDLLARKPHLGTRRPSGDIGQGVTGTTDSVDLAGLLRARAS